MSADCQHVRELMDSYLSGELSVETNHVVLQHLGTCDVCAPEVRRRQRLRALLAQAVDVPVDVERVQARIIHAIDREQRSWARPARWLGVAAALIVGLGVAQWLARPIDAAAYDDSAGDHVACALTFPPSVTFDADRAARNLAPPFENIANAIGLTHGAYHVIDAHMCPYKNREYGHVVLRGNGQTLSVFIERAVRGALPPTPVTTALPGDAVDVHSTTSMGYQVSAAATPGYRLYLVSDGPIAPDSVANEILLSAVRFIRTLER